jgi:hypothetical protein
MIEEAKAWVESAVGNLTEEEIQRAISLIKERGLSEFAEAIEKVLSPVVEEDKSTKKSKKSAE